MISYVVKCTGAKGDTTAQRVQTAIQDCCQKVLLDTNEIESGCDWGVTLNNMVTGCDVLLPIISDGFAVLRPAGDKNGKQSWTLREVQVCVAPVPPSVLLLSPPSRHLLSPALLPALLLPSLRRPLRFHCCLATCSSNHRVNTPAAAPLSACALLCISRHLLHAAAAAARC